MEQFKRAQVVLLPTEKRSNCLAGYNNKSLLFNFKPNYQYTKVYLDSIYAEAFHLYIISDDEKKEGDWLYNSQINKVIKAKVKESHPLSKKIIATTDSSLTKTSFKVFKGLPSHQLPQPSQQFIEKYIESYNKGEVITDVMVEYIDNSYYEFNSLITELTLKTNPKDNTITIRKLKDSWNREEVEVLIYSAMKSRNYTSIQDFRNWIEENL